MGSWLFHIQQRIRFYWSAITRHDIHSPFLAEMVEKVVEDKRWFYAFSTIETLRQYRSNHDGELISPSDFGAGSQFKAAKKIKAGKLLQRSSVPPETGRQLFRLTLWLKPQSMLELGAAQGVSTAYLASADHRTRFITIEGHPPLAQRAGQFLQDLNCGHVTLINASFEEALPKALKLLGHLDFLFVDGDHREEKVVQYARQCLAFSSENCVWVIADIHWSPSMYRAWEHLKGLPGVAFSVDLFHLGILFFKMPQPGKAQHITVVPARWKPWRLGLWGKTF